MKPLDFIKNKHLPFAVLLIQAIVILNITSIIYIVAIESGVYFAAGYDFYNGVILALVVMISSLVFNMVYFFLAFTRIRTWLVLVILGIATGVFIWFLFFAGGAVMIEFAGPLIFGGVIGLYYSTVFYGPAIWMYFRFKTAYLSLGWISILFMSSLLIANAIRLEQGIGEQLTVLLRPDYLLITSIFFFIVFALLILENIEKLAKWKRVPAIRIKLPVFKTLFPVVVILGVVTICTNLTAPIVWKVLWEKVEDGKHEQIQEKDLPQDTDGGKAGNIEKQEDDKGGRDKTKMDPNQGLQDEINKSEGENSILFTVNVGKGEYEDENYEGRYYWKMENMDAFSNKRGFYNDFTYQSDYSSTLSSSSSWFEYLSYESMPRSSVDIYQVFSFYDLETNWVIGLQTQDKMRLLVGPDREYFTFKNSTAVLEEKEPWRSGDSYEMNSWVSTIDTEMDTDSHLKKIQVVHNSDNDDITKYLDIVDDNDIEELAEKIVGDEKNRLLAVKKVRNYLLKNYEYNLKPGGPTDINEETEGLDRIKYFLFDNKKGYCTYFAFAMTAILRTEDIPSRVVGGFAEGNYSEELDAYIVTGNEAHAWVEVFFDEYGWLTFDPTPPDLNEQKESEEDLKKNLTKEVKSELKENMEKALKKKENLDNFKYDDPTPPPETPEWMKDLAESLKPLMMFFMEFIKLFIILLCGTVMLLAVLGPPIINYYIDSKLLGKFKKYDKRQQIIMYFRYLTRKLRKYRTALKISGTETALEFYERLQKKEGIPEEVAKDLFKVCEIYNRAAFRFDVNHNDLEEMEKSTLRISNWIDSRMDLIKTIVSFWWI